MPVFLEPVRQSCHLAILEAGDAGYLAGIPVIADLRIGCEQVGYVVQRDDRAGNESIGRGDDNQGIALLPVAVNQCLCPGQQNRGDLFLDVLPAPLLQCVDRVLG